MYLTLTPRTPRCGLKTLVIILYRHILVRPNNPDILKTDFRILAATRNPSGKSRIWIHAWRVTACNINHPCPPCCISHTTILLAKSSPRIFPSLAILPSPLVCWILDDDWIVSTHASSSLSLLIWIFIRRLDDFNTSSYTPLVR